MLDEYFLRLLSLTFMDMQLVQRIIYIIKGLSLFYLCLFVSLSRCQEMWSKLRIYSESYWIADPMLQMWKIEVELWTGKGRHTGFYLNFYLGQLFVSLESSKNTLSCTNWITDPQQNKHQNIPFSWSNWKDWHSKSITFCLVVLLDIKVILCEWKFLLALTLVYNFKS